MTTNGQIVGKHILAVCAHPDDVEFTSGGSLARWTNEGWTVSLIVCTDGGEWSPNPAIVPAEMAAVCRAEQRAAAGVLSIADCFPGPPCW